MRLTGLMELNGIAKLKTVNLKISHLITAINVCLSLNFYRDMTEDDTAVISSNGQLTLTLVNKDHAGEWRCQATNSSGSIETRTRLIVAPGKGMYHINNGIIHSYVCINISTLAKPLPSPQPDRKHKPIPISEFGTHVKMLHESSNQGFKAEYEVSLLCTVLSYNFYTLIVTVFLQW